MRYYVLSDPHGFYTEMVQALYNKGFFSDMSPRKLIICGDILDRGREALKMQALILHLMENEDILLIRGNHEDLALEFLDHIQKYMTCKELLPFTHHYRNGTVDTFLQLTGINLSNALSNILDFEHEARCTPFVKDIIPVMKNYYETEHYIFVHGWIPCLTDRYTHRSREFYYDPKWREASGLSWENARWYNGIECACSWNVIEPNKTIVCGHYHSSFGHYYYGDCKAEFGKDADYSPFYADGIIALDACTAYSGKVNCIVIDD